MIRDAHEANATVRPADFELARFRAALPEYFDKDGDFRLDRLQEALSSADVSMTREGYELKFLGKSYAKYLTSTRTETVMVPDLEHNAEAANAESENLYIVGDNLDVLKHLLGSYAGQVKCIYIDPPYNTGSDGFVYVDDFGFTAKDLVEKVGLDEDEAERVMALQGKSSHSAWLTFMYPRLELAKELLADDGVIFVSIDDNEQPNLRLLCDEAFGEQNLVGQVAVAKGTTTGQDGGDLGSSIDYLLIYAKSKEDFVLGRLPLDESDEKRFKDSDENGAYSMLQFRKTGTNDRRQDRPNLYYPLRAPDGSEVFPVGPGGYESCWRTSRATFDAWDEEGLIVWKENRYGDTVPYVKYYLDGRTKSVSNFWDDIPWSNTVWNDIEGNKKATKTVKSLVGPGVFSNPKPVELIRRVLSVAGGQDGLVLDFFSGSATTAQAVLEANAADGGSRKFVMVQLPERIDSDKAAYAAGYRTIDEIGRSRISKAAAKVKVGTSADIDYGFRLFRLEKPSEKTLDQLQSFDPNEDGVMLAGDFVSKFASHGTPGDQVALSTWLVQDGFGLTPEVNDVGLDDYKLKVCEDSAYVIEPGLDSDDVMALVTKLEAGELDLKRLVVFGYSVPFSVMHELKQNLASLRSGQTVSVIERY